MGKLRDAAQRGFPGTITQHYDNTEVGAKKTH